MTMKQFRLLLLLEFNFLMNHIYLTFSPLHMRIYHLTDDNETVQATPLFKFNFLMNHIYLTFSPLHMRIYHLTDDNETVQATPTFRV
jgi:hypothetical protein